MKAERVISLITGVLVFCLAIAAFTLSFNALMELAMNNGISARFAWVFPLIVDGAMIVFSLSILRSSLYSEKAPWLWFMVVLFTSASIVFNVLHSANSVLSGVIASVPPIALVLGFETLMRQIKNEVTRMGALQSLDQIAEKIKQGDKEIDKLSTERNKIIDGLDQAIERRKNTLDEINQALKASRQNKREIEKALEEQPKAIDKNMSKAERLEYLLSTYAKDPTKSAPEIAAEFGVSNQTVYNYLGELERDSRVIWDRDNGVVTILTSGKNGHGNAS